jgi:hypothetical protein
MKLLLFFCNELAVSLALEQILGFFSTQKRGHEASRSFWTSIKPVRLNKISHVSVNIPRLPLLVTKLGPWMTCFDFKIVTV